MEARDRVEHLDALALSAHTRDGLLERLGHESLVVHGDVHDVALVGAEDAQRADVGRCLDEHDVTGIAEDARDEVECHLRAGRHDDVIRVRGDADLGHDLEDLRAQRGIALPGSVLKHLGAAIAHETGRGLGEGVQRQRGDEGHAPGEGDDLGAGGDGKEGADLGGRHAAGAGGVGVHPGIES